MYIEINIIMNCDIIKNFEINLTYNRAVFLPDQNFNKNLNILRTKGALKVKLKAFSSFLKGFQL